MIRALARAPAGHPRGNPRISRLVEGLAEVLPEAEGNELSTLKDVVCDLVGATGNDDAADDDDLAARRSPRALRTSIRRAVLLITRALLARAGDGRPAVFVVSGAEAMDTPTKETLSFVAKRLGARARVVLLASQKPRGPLLDDGFVITRREVKPLDAKSARALCNALLDVDQRDGDESGDVDRKHDLGSVAFGRPLEGAVEALFEKAKGSPLFVAHSVRWAVEGGFLKKSSGVLGAEWDASLFFNDDGAARALPNRLDKLLHARVLRLPDTARRVLGHCAALGLTFMPVAVEFVGVRLGIPKDEVQRAVRLLSETGFLARSQRRPGAPVFVDDEDNSGAVARGGGNSDALLVFEHPLLRQAAEQALNDDEAIAVHGVVADALEALFDTGAVAPTLARHHKIAERRRQAVQHLLVAVRRARRLDDREGAITMAKEALDLCSVDESEISFALQLELCAVLEHEGGVRQKGFKDTLKQLVRAAEKTANPRHQASAFARVARFNLFTGDPDKAEDAALRALDKARVADQAVPPGPLSGRAPRDVLRLLALNRFARRDLAAG